MSYACIYIFWCVTSSCGITQKAEKNAAVERLTDYSKFTGCQKLRFDENGRGRGLRDTDSDRFGFVSGFKDLEPYDSNSFDSTFMKQK